MKLSAIAITSVLFLPQARALDDLGIGKQGLRHQVDAQSDGVKALVVSYFGVCFAESKLQPFSSWCLTRCCYSSPITFHPASSKL
jgi:hypothetical protein